MKDLALLARTLMNGNILGLHPGNSPGPGMEFSNYRTYQAGDDLRSLDWKMFARSDRYFIRESEIETHIPIRFLIDSSASMNHMDSGLVKFNYAKMLTACLAYITFRQGENYSLNLISDEIKYLGPGNGSGYFDRFCHYLESESASGTFPFRLPLEEMVLPKRKTLIVFLSDFYPEGKDQIRLLESLRNLGHEVLVFHLMGRNEFDLNFPKFSELEDLETGERVTLSGNDLIQSYRKNINAHMDLIKKSVRDMNMAYQVFFMDEPIEALKWFLINRLKGRLA